MITIDQLKACMPYAGERAPLFLDALNVAMAEFEISTPARVACFLAQVAHESGSLRYTEEIADGKNYEWRQDLGNVYEGDGPKFKGAGLIQVTGRTNTLGCLRDLGKKETDREYLLTPMGASRSAGWFWSQRALNTPADTGAFGSITKIINGGYNGLDDRIRHYVRCRKALGI